jgi:1,2-diacylglycerol-3-alpha-glucose alpha-1,2-galactosyltransferase
MNNRLRIHVVSETAFMMKGQGVDTAFVDCVDLLAGHEDLEVVVNGEGWGNIMHAHTYGPYYFWKGRRYRGRRVFTVHVIPDSIKGSLPAWRLLMPFVRWYLRRVYSYADVCIAISPTVGQAIREIGADTRVVQIYNPIHVEKFAPSQELRAVGRERLGIPEDAFVVLGVGQLEGRKGVEDFLDVAQACPDLFFLWVGGRPFGVLTEGIRRLNERIRTAGEHVTFPGVFDLDDMPTIYNAADLLLFPSYQENCPFVPLEAAAVGLPVIYRDLPEYARLYEKPYLKAGDTGEFITFTKRMATDLSFREEGRSISRSLLAQFDKERIGKQLSALYRDILARDQEPVSNPSDDGGTSPS